MPELRNGRISQAKKRHNNRYHSLVAPPVVKLGTAKQQAQAEGRRSKAAAAEDKQLQQEAAKVAKKSKAIDKAVSVLRPHWTLESLHSDGLEQILESFRTARTRFEGQHTQAMPSPSPSPTRSGPLPEPEPEPEPAEQVEVEGAGSDDSHLDS